jgi:hypothetical protein
MRSAAVGDAEFRFQGKEPLRNLGMDERMKWE